MAKWKRYDLEFKRRVVARMRECDSVAGLAKELKVGRSLLYQWKCQVEGRPESRRADLSQSRVSMVEKKLVEQNRLLKEALGEKTLEADFFVGALRRIEEQRRKSAVCGAIVSTSKSGRGASRRKAN